jgi:hypothetical protein
VLPYCDPWFEPTKILLNTVMPGCGLGSWPLPWAGRARQHAGEISGAKHRRINYQSCKFHYQCIFCNFEKLTVKLAHLCIIFSIILEEGERVTGVNLPYDGPGTLPTFERARWFRFWESMNKTVRLFFLFTKKS